MILFSSWGRGIEFARMREKIQENKPTHIVERKTYSKVKHKSKKKIFFKNIVN
jgi:hypothetical protein